MHHIAIKKHIRKIVNDAFVRANVTSQKKSTDIMSKYSWYLLETHDDWATAPPKHTKSLTWSWKPCASSLTYSPPKGGARYAHENTHTKNITTNVSS